MAGHKRRNLLANYQRGLDTLSARDWRENEPKFFGEVGEYDGIIPKGNPFLKKETCWTRRALLATVASIGKGSPGTALAQPSKVWGEETFKSQKAESIAVLRFAIFFRCTSLFGLWMMILSFCLTNFAAFWNGSNKTQEGFRVLWV